MSEPPMSPGPEGYRLDEEALNGAWAVLKAAGVPDGLLGVFFMERFQSFVLHYEEEDSDYREWVRLPITSLEALPAEVLKEAAHRLVRRISLTRGRA